MLQTKTSLFGLAFGVTTDKPIALNLIGICQSNKSRNWKHPLHPFPAQPMICFLNIKMATITITQESAFSISNLNL